MNIIIIGITGVGKTTVGKMLADKLSVEFIDLDKNIEDSCGVDIQRIFSIEGESGFRKRETQALKRIIDTHTECVISVGGGCVVESQNAKVVVDSGAYVVQLSANTDMLVTRLINNIGKRPLFNDVVNIKNKLMQLCQERENIYNAISSLKIDTSGMRPRDVAEIIAKEFNKFIRKI